MHKPMILGIMQPYFLPYLGYFSLINEVDRFILFDTPQFIRHGWIERNQILKANGEKMYIKVPLEKHSRETPIKDVNIRIEENWKQKIFSQIGHYKKPAEHFHSAKQILKKAFDIQTDSITELNKNVLEVFCEAMGITTPIEVWSDIDADIQEAEEPDEWALNITKALGGDAYYNPIGGLSFFDKKKYEAEGIDIRFLEFLPTPYKQFSNEFMPFLSILDALMFCGVEGVKPMLKNIKWR